MVLKREEALKLINQIWKNYDKKKTGILNKKKSLKLITDMTYTFDDQNILNQVNEILNFLDVDGDGKLCKEELITFLCTDL